MTNVACSAEQDLFLYGKQWAFKYLFLDINTFFITQRKGKRPIGHLSFIHSEIIRLDFFILKKADATEDYIYLYFLLVSTISLPIYLAAFMKTSGIH